MLHRSIVVADAVGYPTLNDVFNLRVVLLFNRGSEKITN